MFIYKTYIIFALTNNVNIVFNQRLTLIKRNLKFSTERVYRNTSSEQLIQLTINIKFIEQFVYTLHEAMSSVEKF